MIEFNLFALEKTIKKTLPYWELIQHVAPMAMRGGKISIYTVRQRMERLEERTNETKLPPIEQLFRSMDEEPELTKELVEHMTFSAYPECKKFSASALKAMLHNSNNLGELRASGIVGSIIEAIRRIDLKQDENINGGHVRHLVESLHTLLKDDESTLTRLVSHPIGTKTIIRLCRSLRNKLQVLVFDILEWIHQMIDGPRELLNYDILKTLLSPTFLFKKTTPMDVRHRAAHLIAVLTPKAPMLFDPEVMNMLVIDNKTGKRRIDGYMEMQLLAAFLVHLAWRDRVDKGFLPFTFTMIGHLLNEVMAETFESVEHMQQIMRIAVVLSRDPLHADYMWTHRLDAALQYLVKTDFSLFRKKSSTNTSSQSEERAKLEKAKQDGNKSKRKSILDTGERTDSTLMFLSLVKPDKTGKKSAAKNEEINYFCTRYVVILYENIINVKMEIVHDLVSSGVVGALLFRVGRGQDRNPRFNKLVVHFLHQMLQKVMLYQDHRGYHMALQPGGKHVKLSVYVGRGDECPPPSPEFLEAKQALIDEANNPTGTASESRPISPIVPSTAPISRMGTAGPASSTSGAENENGSTTGSVGSTAAKGKKQRSMSILEEAMADQAKERLLKVRSNSRENSTPLGEYTVSEGARDFASLTIDTAASTSDMPITPFDSPQHNPGFTPGPGFRKKLANKDTEFDFPTDADGNPIHPPASPMSPIHRHTAPTNRESDGFALGEGGLMDSVELGNDSGLEGGLNGGMSMSLSGSSVVPFAEDSRMLDLEQERPSSSTAATGLDSEKVKEIYRRKLLAQSTDLRSISNTLTAQRVVENFYSTLLAKDGEDPEVVKEAMLSLAIMEFNAYHEIATEKMNLYALFQIYRTRHDLFYPFLSILCEMISSFEVPDSVLKVLMVEHRCIPILLSALNLSGWYFHRRNAVYRCFGKFAQAGFGDIMYTELSDSGGISTICREVSIRKKAMRRGRKGEEEDGDGTEMLLPLLRRDIASIKIQAMARMTKGAKRVDKVRAEHNEFQAFLMGEKAKKEKEESSKQGARSSSRK